jgi:hypothetical protein
MLETKVSVGAGAAGITGLVMWALGEFVFTGGNVPNEVVTFVAWLVPALVGLAAGYLAPHTPRPDLPVATPPAPPVVQ